MHSDVRSPAEVMLDPAQQIFAAQRDVLFRARTVIFAELADVGGIPTWHEECHQAAMTARMGRSAMQSLGAATLGMPFDRLTSEQREYWSVRAPAVLAFGARTHTQLVRLAPSRRPGGPRLVEVAALFQLTASLLDWIADDDGGGAEIQSWLPASEFSRLQTEPAFRCALIVTSQNEARATTAVFIALLCALVERLDALPVDTTACFDSIRAAYEAELASFDPVPAPSNRTAIARAKSVAPTLVVGELACLEASEDDRPVIRRATTIVSPIFSAIDDLADLTSDLRARRITTICQADARLGNAELVDVVRSLLASGQIEALALDVAHAVLTLDALLAEYAVDARRRTAAARWLRTIIWQWLA